MSSSNLSRRRRWFKGAAAAMPLSIAVIPWGVIAGSYAVDAGLNIIQAQMMSAVLFAGSAQLVAAEMFKNQTAMIAMLLAVLIITTRHFLYSLAMRDRLSRLPTRWRLLLGFLLTDELFSVCGSQKPEAFDRWYAFGVGASFYLVWNLASSVGIFLGSRFTGLDQLGLDFAVAATFIAIVVPSIKSSPIVACVLTALVLSMLLHWFGVPSALLISALVAMLVGYLTETLQTRLQHKQQASAEPAESQPISTGSKPIIEGAEQ
ncbi:AzlC family ABC transporter permease [Reinekea thalattae]|nr:AzlC family ABC transporter permease [Reinekea thalattae]